MTKSLPGPGVNENKFQRLCLINKIYVCENAYENGVIFSPKKKSIQIMQMTNFSGKFVANLRARRVGVACT